MSYMKQYKKRKQTLESAQYGLEIILKPVVFENADFFVFVRTETILKTKLLENDESCDFPARVFLKNKSEMTDDCCVVKFLRRSVDEKHLMRPSGLRG